MGTVRNRSQNLSYLARSCINKSDKCPSVIHVPSHELCIAGFSIYSTLLKRQMIASVGEDTNSDLDWTCVSRVIQPATLRMYIPRIQTFQSSNTSRLSHVRKTRAAYLHSSKAETDCNRRVHKPPWQKPTSAPCTAASCANCHRAPKPLPRQHYAPASEATSLHAPSTAPHSTVLLGGRRLSRWYNISRRSGST